MKKVSGGYSSGDSGNNFLNKGTNAGKNAVQKGVRTVSNARRKVKNKINKKISKRAKKSAQKSSKKSFQLLRKIPLKVWFVIFVFIMFFTLISYFVDKQNTGKSDNKVDLNNVLDADGDVIEYSDANASINSFYLALSRNKTTWQEYDDNGETILIRPTDDRAVSDYFGYDKAYVINPELLYAITDYLYDCDIYFYPEAILKPVAYEIEDNNGEKKYTLSKLEGEDQSCLVYSDEIDPYTGDKTGKKVKNVSSYGLATVLTYETKPRYSQVEYTYVSEYTIDQNGMLNWVEIPESQRQRCSSGVIDYKEEHILTNAVTMAGTMNYTYEDTQICTESASGISSDENSNASVINFGQRTAEMYCAVATDGSGNIIYGADVDYLRQTYCNNGAYRLVTKPTTTTETQNVYNERPAGIPDSVWEEIRDTERDIEVEAEEPVKKTVTYTYKKMRSSDSGVYEYWCRNKERNVDDKGSDYLYEYLNLFSTYIPNVTRNYNIFREFTSQAGSDTSSFLTLNDSSSTNGEGGYFGNNVVLNAEQMDTATKVWSALLTLGFTKEQAGGVMGNIYQECRFNHLAVNQSDGGSGLCQWTTYSASGKKVSDRLIKLNSFADSKNKSWEDLDTQLQYMCMELDGNNHYSQTDYIWGAVHGKGCTHFSAKDTWAEFCKEGMPVSHYAHVMAVGFEGAPESYTAVREAYAEELYNLFYDTGIAYDIALIEPDNAVNVDFADSGNVGITTTGFNEEDKQRFYNLYHAVDEDKDLTYTYYSHPLSSDEIDDLLILTNSLVEDTTKSEAKLKYEAEGEMNLWDNGYLSEIAKKKEFSFVGDGTSDWIKVRIAQGSSGHPSGCTVCSLQMIVQNSMTIDTEQYPQYQLEPSDTPYAPANPSAYDLFDASTSGVFAINTDSWDLGGFINYSDMYCNGSFSRVNSDELNAETGANYKGVAYNGGEAIVGFEGKDFCNMSLDEQLEALKPLWAKGYYVAFSIYYVGAVPTASGPAGYKAQHTTVLSCVNDTTIEICDPAGGKLLCYYSADNSSQYPPPSKTYMLVYLVVFKNSLTSPIQDTGSVSVDNTFAPSHSVDNGIVNTEATTEAQD